MTSMDGKSVTCEKPGQPELPLPRGFEQWLRDTTVQPAVSAPDERPPEPGRDDARQEVMRETERAFNLFMSAGVLVGILIVLAMLFGRGL